MRRSDGSQPESDLLHDPEVRTLFTRWSFVRDHTDEMKKVIPAKRVGQKENLAGAAIFLASKTGRFNVGSNIVVDGGESVRGIQRAFYATIWPEFVKLDR